MSDRQSTLDFEAVDFTRSRKSDPETSQASESSVGPKINRIMTEILAVSDETPRTARELAEIAASNRKADGSKVPEIETYRKRARELEVLGKLVEFGTKVCSHTQNPATTYTIAR